MQIAADIAEPHPNKIMWINVDRPDMAVHFVMLLYDIIKLKIFIWWCRLLLLHIDKYEPWIETNRLTTGCRHQSYLYKMFVCK